MAAGPRPAPSLRAQARLDNDQCHPGHRRNPSPPAVVVTPRGSTCANQPRLGRMGPGSAPRRRGLPGTTADDDQGARDQLTRGLVPAARMPEVEAERFTLSTGRRAQGMPGEGPTHGPPAEKSAGGRHHRQSRSTGIPCATVLTLIRSLPGAPACWPPWRQCAFAHCAGHQHRGVGTLRLHVRSLAVRPRIPRTRCGKTTAIAPRPACRDDRAQRPFRMRRDARSRA